MNKAVLLKSLRVSTVRYISEVRLQKIRVLILKTYHQHVNLN